MWKHSDFTCLEVSFQQSLNINKQAGGLKDVLNGALDTFVYSNLASSARIASTPNPSKNSQQREKIIERKQNRENLPAHPTLSYTYLSPMTQRELLSIAT